MDNKPSKEVLISYLGKITLFQNADQMVLSHLADKLLFKNYATGEAIIKKGDVGNTMYLIFDGVAKVHDGEHQVAKLLEGDFFGELSLLDSEPRSMSVSATNDMLIGSMSRSDFFDVLQEFPEMTKDIIAALNKRLRNQNEVLISEFKTREEQLKELVKIRTHELEEKNSELELAMDNLKRSQLQLIQSEKLASLGKLTAGIAHEIQNPLNFVNNFSQFAIDLAEEILSAISQEDRVEIGNDLKQNLAKIHHHGKRAESIVRNMLDHARTSKSPKQLIDINTFCDEFLNLAYHGTRANYPDFNCEVKREYGADLPQIEVVTQEISRVLINLLNNAFYVIKDRKDGIIGIRTERKENNLVITISDNGPGIEKEIKDRIFEPFFTTKPTGEGTGLGLSLSYDIIKSHGGDVIAESQPGKGATFIITIPYQISF